MPFETTIEHFGYLALIVGLLFEGETVLILAAFMAHRGDLSLPVVILIGFVVTFACDQFFFWLGRIGGSRVLDARPSWQPGVLRARAVLERNSNLLFLGFRFIYGFRTVLPFAFGMEGLNPGRFAVLNFIATAIWAVLFGMAGYLFGKVVQEAIGDLQRYELWIAPAVAAVGLTVWWLRRRAAGPHGDGGEAH